MKFIFALGKTLKENYPMIFIGIFLITVFFYYGYITVDGLDTSEASFWEIAFKVLIVMLIGYFMYNTALKTITEIANDYRKNLGGDKIMNETE